MRVDYERSMEASRNKLKASKEVHNLTRCSIKLLPYSIDISSLNRFVAGFRRFVSMRRSF